MLCNGHTSVFQDDDRAGFLHKFAIQREARMASAELWSACKYVSRSTQVMRDAPGNVAL